MPQPSQKILLSQLILFTFLSCHVHVRSKKGSNNFADLHNSVLSPARFNSIQMCSVTIHLRDKTLHKGLWDPMELRTVEKAPEQLRERNEASSLP